ncbi:hypothetical protein GFY24_06895 [Nocardia sp. SYP-A9097]|uniref:hypothetical protein n=1 Tax=Nocardia sp. SYP-A9097 TaxID=2663237 RepID=UPI00129A7EA3|nr:hypothetical protein [Nocardia sp. SYP-A9097]MRH87190.1 hypothetical protein [Nocardia sp. SYP-A9097]
MTTTAKRITTALAATLFILPFGAGIASALPAETGTAAANYDRDDYHWYCDRDSRGFDWNYCWGHYRDRYEREHNNHDNGHHGW